MIALQQQDNGFELLCPSCGQRISTMIAKRNNPIRCLNCGEAFQQTPDYVNLLQPTQSVIEEMSHWDKVSKSGPQIIPDPVIASMFESSRHIISSGIMSVKKDGPVSNVAIAEIGCGTGESAWHLRDVVNQNVSYCGIDVSPHMLEKANTILPHDWKRILVLADANRPVLAPHSVDLVFTCGALHHLAVDRCIPWVARSLRPGGLFIVYEPNFSNPLAALGRRFLEGFHTSTERPLSPRLVQQTCTRFALELKFEKSVGAFSGPMSYGVFILGRRLSPSMKRIAGTAALMGDQIVKVIPDLNITLSYYFLKIFQKDNISFSEE